MSERFAQFKLVLLGESAVGKSSLVNRFAKDRFDEFRQSTIGAAFLTQSVRLEPDTVIKFEIWDTAGQERYKSLAPMYYRNANCAVVVFDLTSSTSLGRAKSWVKELQLQASDNIVIALAANKADLTSERQVDREEAAEYAREAGLLYFETSAKTGENVKEMFKAIAERMPIEDVERERERAERRALDLNRAQQNGCAC